MTLEGRYPTNRFSSLDHVFSDRFKSRRSLERYCRCRSRNESYILLHSGSLALPMMSIELSSRGSEYMVRLRRAANDPEFLGSMPNIYRSHLLPQSQPLVSQFTLVDLLTIIKVTNSS
jgi:hypothetical protein